jgi:hypothetical protein
MPILNQNNLKVNQNMARRHALSPLEIATPVSESININEEMIVEAEPSEFSKKKESVSRHLSSLWSITEMEEDYLTTKPGGHSMEPAFNAVVNMADINADETVAEEDEGKANNISDIRKILYK